jgi:cytochrome c oxidase subunit II
MNEATNYVKGVDHAFYFILGIDAFFLIGITAVMIFFVIKFSRKRNPKATQIKERMWLEVTWTIIPLILVLWMFYYGYAAYKPGRNVPKDALKITAIGRMWEWNFVYENGKESNKLYVPVGRPIVLKLESKDVVHSLYIPAFRIKEDMVAGKENYLWFTPTVKDTFEIFCAEYCGVRHSYMLSSVIVLDEKDYKSWVSKVEKQVATQDMAGFKLLKDNGCVGCHSLDGTKIVGPSFKGLFGSKHKVLTNGTEREITADEEYIKNSILDPNKDVVKDFPQGLMQPYKTVLKDKDIQAIVDYFKAEKSK